MAKKIAFLHRYPEDRIKETNAAAPFIIYGWDIHFDLGPGAVNCWPKKRMDVLTFKTFPRLSKWAKFFKSLAWIFYAPLMVFGKGYEVIYCDDSFPFYPALVKMVSPKSKVWVRIGDFHLMYHTSGILFKILHALEIQTWKMVDGRIAISKVMAEYIESKCHKKTHTVLDPVDVRDFHSGKFKNHGTVMFHGTLVKNKKVDLLLECAKRIPDVLFVVVGDGPDRKRLEKKAPDNVLFKGWIPFAKMSKEIESCAVGVALRSDNPGNEYVVTSPFIQYGIMGKPCLVTKRKVFAKYPWQFENPDEMEEKLRFLLKHPEEGERLRNFILDNHKAENIAGEIWETISR